MYLHEQLRLVGTEPVLLERVSTYRGLSSRSIRVCLFFFNPSSPSPLCQTLLVHMENSVRKLHQQTLAEEQVVCPTIDTIRDPDLCQICSSSTFAARWCLLKKRNKSPLPPKNSEGIRWLPVSKPAQDPTFHSYICLRVPFFGHTYTMFLNLF